MRSNAGSRRSVLILSSFDASGEFRVDRRDRLPDLALPSVGIVAVVVVPSGVRFSYGLVFVPTVNGQLHVPELFDARQKFSGFVVVTGPSFI